MPKMAWNQIVSFGIEWRALAVLVKLARMQAVSYTVYHTLYDNVDKRRLADWLDSDGPHLTIVFTVISVIALNFGERLSFNYSSLCFPFFN